MNQQLMIDALVRRQIFLGRYANRTNRDAQEQLNDVLTSIQRRIAVGDLSTFQSEWLVAQFNAVAEIAFDAAESLAPPEADFTARVLAAGGIEGVEQVIASDVIATFNEEQAELINGKTIQKLTPFEMTQVYSEGEAESVLRIFRTGRSEGLTNREIAGQIDSMLRPVSSRHTDTLVRTLTNQAASVARTDTYELNDIEFEEYVSVLDARTTTTCASLSGNLYRQGEGVYPPRHYNCRSLRVPWFDGETYIDETGQRKVTSDSTGETYGDWLGDQPKATQEEVLGVERAELFSSGELEIEQFTDKRGIEYTLDELESLYDITIETA